MAPFKPLLLASALVASLSLSACASRYAETPFDMNPPMAMAKASYKAADMLAGQSLNVVGRDTPIAVGTLSDVNQIETSTAFGRAIAEQLGARFVQLGYNVSEIKLRNDINVFQTADNADVAGEYMFSRERAELAGNTDAQAIVSGTYAVAGDNVLVNVRMVDVSSSRVLAAYDYAVPMNDDTRTLIEKDVNQTAIFSTGWSQ